MMICDDADKDAMNVRNASDLIQQNIIDRSKNDGSDRSCMDSFSEIDDHTMTHSLSDDPARAPSNHPIENEATKRDTERVCHMKLLVLMILIISAIGIAVFAYKYIASDEMEHFHSKFYNDADKVVNAVGSSFERTLTTLNAFSILLVTYSQNNNDHEDPNATTWPFVTLPNFAGQASKLLPITNGLYIAVLPIVTPSQKQEWEEYAYQHDEWVNESLALQEVWNGYHGNISYDWARSKSIYDNYDIVYPNVSRMMLPQWQTFPVPPVVGYELYNWDWNSATNTSSLQACIDSQQPILSETYMIPNETDVAGKAETEVYAEFFRNFLPSDENAMEPVMDVYYPILNDLSPNAIAGKIFKNRTTLSGITNTTNTTREVVGVVVITIYWRDFIRNILPEGSNGIIFMVQNPCHNSFSYKINGPNVEYLGVGDTDTDLDIYSGLHISKNVVDLNEFAIQRFIYTGAPIDTAFCPYTAHIYASNQMKSEYTTSNGVVFMVVVLLIFAFTSAVFFTYDWFVERRQNRVMSTAIRSTAIVSSLFPSTVRDQLYPTSDVFENGVNHSTFDPNGTSTAIIGSPIAQVYPETTVIFADIVGFTSWSAIREPTQVFHLLETVYAGFDALAKVHGVFKIETIGDSYVAVVGLPQPRKRHALIMVKFANDIRRRMMEMTKDLAPTLGPETSNLVLRIGLNSGPTTAGVLRGEKARFQLFGDTVNTASRMESNGTPNKIHVSATTAEALIASGKEHWLQARQETIMVKGKGMMQTYWCEPSVVTSGNDRFPNSERSNSTVAYDI